MNRIHQLLGFSHEKKPIETYSYGDGPVSVLLLGGVHGDEVEGFDLAERVLSTLDANRYDLPSRLRLTICPRLNPDGCAQLRRTNAHNVDLNRNLPTQDWEGKFSNPRYYPGSCPGSEPENQALMALINSNTPKLILSLHSYEKPMVNFNGEISRAIAEKMSEKNHLEAKGDIGYPTPGSLGTYGAIERGIPTITLEIMRGQNLDQAWDTHFTAVKAALEFMNSKHPKSFIQ